MNELIKDIIKTIFTRLKQPSSASSLAVLISYMGIAEAVELSNAVCTFLVSGFSIWGIVKNDGSDKK
tara:strand:+ start:184 stop:384 length:201 start_codon:yes stop_codon:yes gene_type:complete